MVRVTGFEPTASWSRTMREAVAQVMQAGLREADRGHKALVVVIDRVGRQALPDLVAEHEPGILPQRPGLQLRLRLLGLVPLQELDHEGRGSNGPALAVLGGDKVELPRTVGDLLELFVDGDGPALQVDAVPGEAAGFPTAQACKEHGQIDGLETVALDGLEKSGGGGFVQRLDLLLLHQGELTGVGGVEADIAHLHRLLESLVENAVEVLDCLWGVVNAQTVVELLNGGAAAVEINQGTYTAPSKMTVGQWLDIWERDYLGSVKPLTVLNYSQNIRNHLKPAMGAIRLEALDAPTIQKLYNSLSVDHAPKTIKNLQSSPGPPSGSCP